VTTIQLQEWSEAEDVELSFDQVNALRTAAGHAITISPGRRRDTWNLKATSYVGAIRVGDLAVMVQPKIPLENLFYMLSAGQAEVDFGTSLVGFEEDELLPALAAFYERLVAHTLRRGVLKAYKEHDETLVALRGRIDIPAMLRAGGMPAPIACRFDELSVDIPENRILRTAAVILATFPDVAPAVRRNLRHTVGVLDGVEAVDPRAIPPINLTRLNRYYEPALRMAQVILWSGGIKDRAGKLEASTFLIDMNHLFERFVTIQLRRLLAGRLEVRDQVKTYLDTGQKVTMYPDLVFHRRGEPVLVADVKYKLTDDGLGRNADYYQLLAYCKALDLTNGVLLYAGDVESSTIRVQHEGAEMLVMPLDLTGDSAAIERMLECVAQTVLIARTRATRRVARSRRSVLPRGRLDAALR
jgi:5-methylcytosine-specific restriction enzyme subunit McrC